MYEIIKAAYDIGFEGPIRPDHGRMIWGKKAVLAMAYTTEPLARIIFAVYGMLLIVRAGSFKGGFMNAPFKSKKLKTR